MNEIIMSYAAQGAYTVALFVVGYLWRSLMATKSDHQLIKAGVRSLLRDRIINMCEKCLTGGYCTTEYHDNIVDMYKEYHALGGNGAVTRLLNRVEELPHRPPEKTDG